MFDKESAAVIISEQILNNSRKNVSLFCFCILCYSKLKRFLRQLPPRKTAPNPKTNPNPNRGGQFSLVAIVRIPLKSYEINSYRNYKNFKIGDSAKIDLCVTERSSHQRCSVKKMFLEISKNLQENTCARVSQASNFVKK